MFFSGLIYLQDVGVKEAASSSGSDLTMGTSVTFAGNPVMAMRRLREESAKPQEKSSVIIDTLDNFDRNVEGKTLAEVKAEFKNFNLDEAVAKLRKNSKRHQGWCPGETCERVRVNCVCVPVFVRACVPVCVFTCVCAYV